MGVVLDSLHDLCLIRADSASNLVYVEIDGLEFHDKFPNIFLSW